MKNYIKYTAIATALILVPTMASADDNLWDDETIDMEYYNTWGVLPLGDPSITGKYYDPTTQATLTVYDDETYVMEYNGITNIGYYDKHFFVNEEMGEINRFEYNGFTLSVFGITFVKQ